MVVYGYGTKKTDGNGPNKQSFLIYSDGEIRVGFTSEEKRTGVQYFTILQQNKTSN